ncbi:hypothetical protein PpBr36_02920 [Pyricularia pennisetigena]|uniref:hypothetical protein n=1 Tax=Pyricularia pennisetigena TaxID=1578925 RepID=UPI001153444E|nr:hypothetical protein PpBr36_02920 [Pyricularia pennisetigena]TLS30429.1 hypothetical protein PpBr36_02920 [Pyricularia pennisetigena]
MGSNRKRTHSATIDLTGDDDSTTPSKHPRNAPSSSASNSRSGEPPSRKSLATSNQAPSSTQLYEVDDPNSRALNQSDNSPELELYGSLDVKIVGCRYYNGIVSPGELTICRREPTNPYDVNAIRVDNVQGVQIGHFPRKIVEKLAPYVDANEIAIEAKIMGEKATFDCPAKIFIFGTSEPLARAQLETRLKNDKLVNATQLKQTKRESELRRLPLEITGTSTQSLKNMRPGQQNPQEAMEKLIGQSQVIKARSGDDLVKSFAMNEEALSALPCTDQPQGLKSQLLPYQLQGLAWLTKKENPEFPEQGSDDNTQLWKVDARGRYRNLATEFTTAKAPKLISGGILADDMGLGKTLQIISLILTGGSGPTLIVAPMTVMSNWSQQIKNHVYENARPSVYVHHGSSRCKDPKEVGSHGVVITTYGTMTSERHNGPLCKVQWRRVVLDEGHTIRNSTTQTAEAACELKATSRWVLSGTPIVNSILDLHSLLKFLKITGGLESLEVFRSVIQRGLSFGDSRAESLLQALMGDLCLRRNKNMKFVDLKLPPKTHYVHRITFTDAEQKKYDAVLSEAKGVLDDIRKNPRTSQNGGFTSVLERLLRLRQMCCHWTLCKGRVKDVLSLLEEQKVVDLTPENRQILEEALRLLVESQDDCAVCLDTLDDPVITHCKHAFCRKCIMQVVGVQHKCPLCRTELSEDKLVEPAKEDVDSSVQVDDFDELAGSSKTDALLKILDGTLLKNPSSKVIIFSQWTSFLNVIQQQLGHTTYGYARIDGTMKPAARDDAMKKLETDPDTRILLASLGVCSVGLNLVAADTVILADSWWAPAIEDQAIDRVHRLGQTRATTVWRLVMEGTVEERVLDIQAEKRDLVSKAFQEKGKKTKAKETRMADIMRLLG